MKIGGCLLQGVLLWHIAGHGAAALSARALAAAAELPAQRVGGFLIQRSARLGLGLDDRGSELQWQNPGGQTGNQLPACNWTYDDDAVARPAHCFTNATLGGNISCVIVANGTFDRSSTANCTPPPVLPCTGVPQADPLYAAAQVGNGDHGSSINYTCAWNATAVNVSFPVTSWNETWYPGIASTLVTCNNGSWQHLDVDFVRRLAKPQKLHCEEQQGVTQLKAMMHYMSWSKETLGETEARNFTFYDEDAITRIKTLKDAVSHANDLLNMTLRTGVLPGTRDMNLTTKTMLANRVVPRGEPFSDAVCKDLEKHNVWQIPPTHTVQGLGYSNYLPPGSTGANLEPALLFSCNYMKHETPAGYDSHGVPVVNFREGCYCETRFAGGCPFRLSSVVPYTSFGFQSLDERQVSTEPGVFANALCWYWSNHTYPEQGYVRNDTAIGYQEPAVNSTELRREWNQLRSAAR